jgi:hypothetical protein
MASIEQTQSNFDRLPDSLLVDILTRAAGNAFEPAGWAGVGSLLGLRLVCMRFSDLVFEVQHVSLWYKARGESEITHFLDRTEGILKGLHLRAAYGRRLFTVPMIVTLVARVHALTPHLEDFRLTFGSRMFEIIREESLARVQSEQLLSSISRFQKLASMSLDGVRLNLTSFSLLGRIRFEQLKHLTLRNLASYSVCGEYRNLLKISDETFEDLVEICPRLEELKIIGGTGLRNPVIMSKILQTLDLVVDIERSLTVHAPLLSFCPFREFLQAQIHALVRTFTPLFVEKRGSTVTFVCHTQSRR